MLLAFKYNNGSLIDKIVVCWPMMLATYKLPPIQTSWLNAAPPVTVNVPPLVVPVALVPNVKVTAPPTPNVLLICVAPPMVVVNAIFAAPATLIPPLGTTIAPVPCVVVAILAFAHRLFAALNVVNAPVEAVALPTGVALILAN